MTGREAQNRLSKNPAIEIRRTDGGTELVAVFQRDYMAQLGERVHARTRRSAPLRQKVEDATRRILTAARGKDLRYVDLINQLQAEIGCPKPTLYSYVADLDFVEIVSIPGQGGKLCHLKDAVAYELKLAAQKIHTQPLRTNVERAIQRLNEDEVDIALQLLAKEFEAALRSYLGAAKQRGLISPQKDPERMMLADLVTCASQNGLITEKGALQYLREQRNERSHGTTPSIEERRILFEGEPHFSSMYVRYIRFLDDRRRALQELPFDSPNAAVGQSTSSS
jgi:hypothetical protein